MPQRSQSLLSPEALQQIWSQLPNFGAKTRGFDVSPEET